MNPGKESETLEFKKTMTSQIYPVVKKERMNGKHVRKVEFGGEDKLHSASGKFQ